MNRKLVAVLIALFLTACAGRTVRDDSPASDLDAAKANLERHLAPRTLSNGELYCAEFAQTEDAQDECLGELEDKFFLSEEDKRTSLALVRKFIDRLRLARAPCRWYQFTCKRQEKKLNGPD